MPMVCCRCQVRAAAFQMGRSSTNDEYIGIARPLLPSSSSLFISPSYSPSRSRSPSPLLVFFRFQVLNYTPQPWGEHGPLRRPPHTLAPRSKNDGKHLPRRRSQRSASPRPFPRRRRNHRRPHQSPRCRHLHGRLLAHMGAAHSTSDHPAPRGSGQGREGGRVRETEGGGGERKRTHQIVLLEYDPIRSYSYSGIQFRNVCHICVMCCDS